MPMNIQHRSTPELEQSLAEIDHTISAIDRGSRDVLQPTTSLENHRRAIVALVDNLATDLCTQVETLRKTLDRIQQQVLTSAERSRATLQEHVSVCQRVADEVKHMREVIDELEHDTHEV
jgi:methyl-accepting chemotaxis protein